MRRSTCKSHAQSARMRHVSCCAHRDWAHASRTPRRGRFPHHKLIPEDFRLCRARPTNVAQLHKIGRTGEEGGGYSHAVESLYQTGKIVVHGADRWRPAPRVVHPLRGWLPAPNSVVGKNGSAAGGSTRQNKATHGQQSQRGQCAGHALQGARCSRRRGADPPGAVQEKRVAI